MRFYVCSNGERKDVEVNTAIRNSQKASEDVAGELDDLKRKELVFDGGVSKLKAAFVGLFVLLELIDEVLANVAHEVLVNVLDLFSVRLYCVQLRACYTLEVL